MEEAWKEIKEEMRAELPRSSFSLWIKPIVFLGRENGSILLGCPNRFSKNWVTENYLPVIKEKLFKQGLKGLEVELKVVQQNRVDAPGQNASSHPTALHYEAGGNRPHQLFLPNLAKGLSSHPTAGIGGRLLLNKHYTFERFVVGKSNEFAYSASKAIAHGSCPDYNMLLLLANTGLGKTHLSQAVGHLILRHNPQCRVFYVTAEEFTNEMISSLRNNCIDRFKNKYRALCDVLLLEEIHFLSGKLKIQQELAHTLDALASDRKKIIFTSSLPPKQIPSFSRDLSSRVTAGLVSTIEAPDFETRVKIIMHKASEQGLNLSSKIIELLAEGLSDDVRHLESALRCLKAKSELLNQKITLELAREVISHLSSQRNSLDLEKIQDLVCTYYKVGQEELKSKSRKKIHVLPRNIYIYLSRQHTEKSVEQIARSINRSHSTVLYACEVINRKMAQDPKLRREIHFLSDKLHGTK